MASSYNFHPSQIGVYADLNTTLEEYTSTLYSAFQALVSVNYTPSEVCTYTHMAGKCTCVLLTHMHVAHQCNIPGCRTVMVLDGNMKNYRDVCKAKDPGFIEFDGLSGML